MQKIFAITSKKTNTELSAYCIGEREREREKEKEKERIVQSSAFYLCVFSSIRFMWVSVQIPRRSDNLLLVLELPLIKQ